MTYCDACGNQFSDVCGTCESLEGVPVKYKRKTNADRIRNMTDEELADWLCHIVSNETVNCSHCIVEEYCEMGRNGFKKWLKQEVSDDS